MESSNKKVSIGGHEFEIKPYITGEDAETLLDVSGETEGRKNVAALHAMIGLVVVSMDGTADDIVGRVRKLPFNFYTELSETVTEIATGKKKEASTPPTSSTS